MPAELQELLHRALSGLSHPPSGPFTIRLVGGGSINQAFQISTKDNAPEMGLFKKYPISGRSANDESFGEASSLASPRQNFVLAAGKDSFASLRLPSPKGSDTAGERSSPGATWFCKFNDKDVFPGLICKRS